MLHYTEEYLCDLCEASTSHLDLEKLASKKVLVTGASGLICSALVDQLLIWNKMHKLDMVIYAAGRSKEKMMRRFSYWGGQDCFRFCQYDAKLPFHAESGFDYIIHGASNASPAVYAAEPVETMLSNFIGTQNLLNEIRQKKAGRFLYISSSEIYGEKDGTLPYSENSYGFVDILNPRACYPSSKRAAETLCAAYKKEYGVDVVIIRPGHVYGPTMTDTDNRASSQFPRDVKAGKNIIMKSAGTQLRSYCYVLDCATAILTVLLNGESGEAYNVSNKNSVVTIREMAEAFAEVGGKKLIFEEATKAESASFNLMQNSSLTSEKIEALGWSAQFDMLSGARRTLNSMF